MKIQSKNPSRNHEVMATFDETTKEECVVIVEKAKAAFKGWKETPIKERIKLLEVARDSMWEKREDLARFISLEMGKPITQAESEVSGGIKRMAWDLENVEKYTAPEVTFENETEKHVVTYEPRGVALVITPFNYPFTQVMGAIWQNLLVGNVVVLKPCVSTPQFNKLLEETFKNLPKGVITFVHAGRDVGAYLSEQDFDMLHFTGSTSVGRNLAKIAAEKLIPIHLELGGSAPGIILEDADIEEATRLAYFRRFNNAGQVCTGLKRLIVQETVFDRVIAKLKELAEAEVIGDAIDRKTTLGPVVNEAALKYIEEQVKDAVSQGATVIYGAKRPKGLEGSYYQPTILAGTVTSSKIWVEETFGPVLPVVSFKTIEEAIALANDSEYNLAAYVYTNDKKAYERIAKELTSMNTTVNELHFANPYNPFGGTKSSGVGRIRGKWGFRELTNIRVITSFK
ncbi:MAG: aldehyde dehydrogenase family protein [Firmicutes bacterium]|nr:aldehyde dehydrogenase family protein [Bacillota bacterium]